MRKLMSLVFLCGSLSFTAHAGPEVGKPAPDFKGITSSGEEVMLSELRGEPVILEWTNHECPYVVKHYKGGNMQNTQRELTEDGVTWISVISSAPGKQGHVSADKANELTTSRGVYADMVVIDESGEIGKLYDAKTSPHMFLIDEAGILQYMGAIDDKPSAHPSSLKDATNYVLAAWEKVSAGEAADPASTKPYGCSVKYSD